MSGQRSGPDKLARVVGKYSGLVICDQALMHDQAKENEMPWRETRLLVLRPAWPDLRVLRRRCGGRGFAAKVNGKSPR